MKEWKTYLLKDVCSRLSSGKGIRASEVFDAGKYPVYGGNGLRGYADKENFTGDCAIIGRQGAYCGNVRYFRGTGYMTEHAVVVVANSQNNTRYLSYLLSTMNLGRLSGQSAQPGLSVKTLGEQAITLPSLATQNKIVSILACLDDKIEKNDEINKNLLDQATSIFIEYFITSENTTPGTISDVASNITDGVHNTVHDDPEGKYLLLSCKNIKGGHLTLGEKERTINKETFDKLRARTKLAKGDVLISSVGTIGELMLVNNNPDNYEFQRSVAIVKPDLSVVSPYYLYMALSVQKEELIHAAHGAVQQCLFISDISGFPIGIPDKLALEKYNKLEKFQVRG